MKGELKEGFSQGLSVLSFLLFPFRPPCVKKVLSPLINPPVFGLYINFMVQVYQTLSVKTAV